MPFDWFEKITELGLGGLSKAAATAIPEHVKKQVLARLGDANPFKQTSVNHDLVRATRLAWIAAALDVIAAAQVAAGAQDDVRRVAELAVTALRQARAVAFDRDKDPLLSPIDRHVEALMHGVPEFAAPQGSQAAAEAVTAEFEIVLAEIVSWPPAEMPAIFRQAAASGLSTKGGGPRRSFGELVFAEFAEILKDPQDYPQASAAFQIATNKLARDLAEQTFAAVEGLDSKLDQVLAGAGAFAVFRDGLSHYLALLPQVADDVREMRRQIDGIERAVERLPDAVSEKVVNAFEKREQARAAEEAGVHRVVIMALAKRITKVETLDQALVELERAVEIAIEVQCEGARGSNAGDVVDEVLRRIATLSGQGRLDEAAAEADKAFARWQEEEAERQQAALQSGLKLLDAGIAQDLLRRDAASAARRIAMKSDLEVPEPSARFAALWRVQDEWHKRGRDKGVNLDLEVSIEIGRLGLARAEDGRERGACWIQLGNTLSRLGERERGVARLEEAVSLYRAALLERPREHVPLDWAMAQNNLGAALRSIGERERGVERLEEAVSAFRAALLEYSRERAPLYWAATQTNLGAALLSIGERESGTERLKEAISAYRAALLERTRERAPLDWAMTQNNLGNALSILGRRESWKERLVEAVSAYRAALLERTRERGPLDWAATQVNLGAALSMLAELDENIDLFNEAVSACRFALLEYARERVPLAWAMTQHNLGNTLQAFGKRESGTKRLEEAVSAYSAALLERAREHLPLDWAMSFGGQGEAKRLIAERRADRALAEAALAQIEEALDLAEQAEHGPLTIYLSEQAVVARDLVTKLREPRDHPATGIFPPAGVQRADGTQ